MTVNALRFKPNDRAWELVPDHMQGAMDRYISYGIPPGSFLESVLSNDLRGAVTRADNINRHRLAEIVQFLQWAAPMACWGSVEAVNGWVVLGGFSGLEDQKRNEDAGYP